MLMLRLEIKSKFQKSYKDLSDDKIDSDVRSYIEFYQKKS